MPVCRQIDIIALKYGTADGIFHAIKEALSTFDLTLDQLKPDCNDAPNLIMANFDGASVNFGNKNGVVTKLKNVIPEIYALQCIAHKLELAVFDAVNCWEYLKNTFETIVKGIYNFYHYSPKRRREIKDIADVMEKDFAHLSNVKQVRWLSSKQNALNAVKNNYCIIVSHLENSNVQGTRADDANRALGYHKKITSLNFVKVLNFMLDFLKIVSDLSKVFQSETVLVFEVPVFIDQTLMLLEALKTTPGENMKHFTDNFNLETMVYDMRW